VTTTTPTKATAVTTTSTQTPPTTTSALTLSDVVMTYPPRKKTGSVTALDGIDLDVQKNEFVTIVGPSGCGKSTILKIVAGLALPSAGEVELGGEPVYSPSSDVGLVFQQPVLLPWRTVLQNVTLPLEVLGRTHGSNAERTERGMELLRLVGLESYAGHYPTELSGGMQQRVSIARALSHNPSVLLMDEPFGALDALTRDQMSLELMRIWDQNAKTVLFVTHSVPEAVLLADRIVVMTAGPGRIAEIVTVDLPRPRDNSMINTPEFGDYVQRIRGLLNADSTAH
jgi:NitT/TauT family transport system ATP-binding protein